MRYESPNCTKRLPAWFQAACFSILIFITACAPPIAKRNKDLLAVNAAFAKLLAAQPNACVCQGGSGRGSFSLVPACHTTICPSLPPIGVQVAYTLSGADPGTLQSYCGDSANGLPTKCVGQITGQGVASSSVLTSFYDPSKELIAFELLPTVTALEDPVDGLNLSFSILETAYNNSVPLGLVNITGVMEFESNPEDLLSYICRPIVTTNNVRTVTGAPIPLFTGSFTGADVYCFGRNFDPAHVNAPFVIHNYAKPPGFESGVPPYIKVDLENSNPFEPTSAPPLLLPRGFRRLW